MDFNFDIRGHLTPYKIIEAPIESLQTMFVDSFEENSIRHELWQNYNSYMDELSKVINHDFSQWIDGSFISKKQKPKDIDFITILDYRDYESSRTYLEKEFASFAGRKNFKVDAYIVSSYPKSHKKHIFTRSDLLYWRNLFGKTKVNRARKQYEKGFIQLNFNKK